jgi:integrase
MRPRKTDRHLPPCVYNKHGSYWLVKRGKWERIGLTLPEALAEYARRIETPVGGMAELIEKVHKHHTPTLSASTRKTYGIVKTQLCGYFREFSPEQVKGKHVAAVKLKLADKPMWANQTLNVLRTVFSYAVEWQIVDSNPCAGIKPYPAKARGRYLTDEEFAAIRVKSGPRLQIIMDLCYLTGQRVSDVLGIHHRDINDGGIYFKAAKTEKSTQIQFVVGWTDDLRAAVDAAKALQGGVLTLYLLATRSRRPLTYATVRQQWQNACIEAGIEDAHLHDIRAKSATDAKAQGLDAQVLLGHNDAQMTKRYLRLRETPVVRGPSFRRG